MCLAKKFTVAGQTIPYAIDNVHNAVALWKQTSLTVNESYKWHNNLYQRDASSHADEFDGSLVAVQVVARSYGS